MYNLQYMQIKIILISDSRGMGAVAVDRLHSHGCHPVGLIQPSQGLINKVSVPDSYYVYL